MNWISQNQSRVLCWTVKNSGSIAPQNAAFSELSFMKLPAVLKGLSGIRGEEGKGRERRGDETIAKVPDTFCGCFSSTLNLFKPGHSLVYWSSTEVVKRVETPLNWL